MNSRFGPIVPDEYFKIPRVDIPHVDEHVGKHPLRVLQHVVLELFAPMPRSNLLILACDMHL